MNYDLHLGHLVACLLRPDIYGRFLRLKNEDVIVVCGSDEYGTPSLVAAEKEGITPQKLCDKYHKLQKDSIEKLNLKFDIYSRTTTPEHIKVVQDFYYKLKQNNYVYRKEIEQLYCEKCNRALPDRYVKGICPYCKSDKAKGDQCESCGKVLEPTQLEEPKCLTCNEKPVLKKREHVFFELSKLNEPLLKWVEEQKQWPDNARNFALNWLKEGLQDKDISRDINWGVPIPDAEGLVFYVWFDAPIGYITFTKQLGKENWFKDKNTKIVHFIGKDNIAFHTISFPGMLYANGEYQLPSQVSSCEFLNYEGGKFSKSEGRGVFLADAVSLYPADYWRYYVTTVIPDNKDSSFEWKEFENTINSDLNDTIGNFIHRTLTFSRNFFNGIIEKPQLTSADNDVLLRINETAEKAEKLMYEIKLKNALQEIVNLARLGNEFISKEEPWKNEKRRKNVIYVSLQIAKALSVLLEPFIPETSDKIKEYLGLDKINWNGAKTLEDKFIISQSFIPLFKKIDSKETEINMKKFGFVKPKKENKKIEKKKTEKKNEELKNKQVEKQKIEIEGIKIINYDDFSKLELKVAEVKKVEKVEGADKLLKLSINLGNEERTIVAGMAPYYKPEEITGKKIIVVANLESRKMKGIESQGMLLAAEKDGIVSLLTVDRDISAGASIK